MSGQHLKRVVTLAVLAAAGCGNGATAVDEGPEYRPQIAARWAGRVSNPLFPLIPGTVYEYATGSGASREVTMVEILRETRQVNGVAATVARDRVFRNGELVEDTYDWYAQDDAGNVWYLGEETKEYERGRVVSTEGSWEWGKDGALPGVIMWADPATKVGVSYRQEYYRGEAEDWGKVVAVGERVELPFGTFAGCVRIEEWNALQPGPHDHKLYCPQVGLAYEVPIGGGERNTLVRLTRP